MEITFYKASFEEASASEYVVIKVSEQLYERLGNSDFDFIGRTEKISMNIDEEMIDISVVTISSTFRVAFLTYLHNLLVDISSERHNYGENIKAEKYKSYFDDELSIISMIKLFGNNEITHVEK